MRFLLIIAIAVLIPLFLYSTMAQRRRQNRGETEDASPPAWYERGVLLWVMAGLILALAAGLILVAVQSGEKPGGTYVPPKVQDGEVVPGHVDRP